MYVTEMEFVVFILPDNHDPDRSILSHSLFPIPANCLFPVF